MAIHVIGDFDPDKLYCAGSFTKLLTTYVCLAFLAENYVLDEIVDDVDFLDKIALTEEAQEFLALFQKIIGGRFSIHDLCSYYSGLPYTFDLAEKELALVESGHPFKHHSILAEDEFLYRCKYKITQVYPNRSKFHYSEIAIIFLGYFIEKSANVRIEDLYQKFLINAFQLTASYFSRTRLPDVYTQDLSDKYDYPSIAILDHGYFCYSNGYYTTLHDMKKLLEQLLKASVFKCMTDLKKARAASNRLLNGMAVEMRLVGDDVVYGYEGLSFSGCNIWAYSTLKQEGYVAFTNSEEDAYPLLYDRWNYQEFDRVPEYTQKYYRDFIKRYDFSVSSKNIPEEYQGKYQRVNINEKTLEIIFHVGADFIVIRNPDEIKYDIVFYDKNFCIKNKDGVHGGSVAFYEAESGNRYMLYDGTLYKHMKYQ